jgi:hypothetical protein
MKKEVIVPTNTWLNPIKKLISKQVTTAGLLILSELLNKEKVVVKITKMNSKYLLIITKILSNEPNFINNIITFTCNENEYYIKNNYKNINSFCNGQENDKIITVEVMKRYKGNISDFEGKLTIQQTKNILAQLINAQLNFFYKYGFVHNDIHKGNILYEYSNVNKKNLYLICKSPFGKDRMVINDYNIKLGEIIPIICDFDKSQCLNPDIFNQYDKNFLNNIKDNFNEYSFTLISNLTKTIDLCVLLLNNLNDKRINLLKTKIRDTIQSQQYEIWSISCIKKYDKYFNGIIKWEEFRDSTISLCSPFINSVMYNFDDTNKIIPDKCFISVINK